MSAAISLNIDNHNYSLQNCGSGGSVIKGFSEYTGTGKGTYYTLGVGQKISEAGVYAASFLSLSADRVKDLTFLSSWIAGARSLLIVTKLTSDTIKAFFDNAFEWLTDSTKLAGLAYAFADMIKDLMTFLELFRLPELGKFILTRVGAAFSFVVSTWDLKKSWDGFHLCKEIEKKALRLTNQADMQKLLTFTAERKRYLILNVIADLIDYAVTIFLFASFIFSLGSLPGVALWGIGAAAFFIKYASDVYEQSMTFKLKDEGKIA